MDFLLNLSIYMVENALIFSQGILVFLTLLVFFETVNQYQSKNPNENGAYLIYSVFITAINGMLVGLTLFTTESSQIGMFLISLATTVVLAKRSLKSSAVIFKKTDAVTT